MLLKKINWFYSIFVDPPSRPVFIFFHPKLYVAIASASHYDNHDNTCMFQIHIDGHSDMAPPDYVKGFPFFKWPLNEAELYVMMQKNDVFIQVCMKLQWNLPLTAPLIRGHLSFEDTSS